MSELQEITNKAEYIKRKEGCRVTRDESIEDLCELIIRLAKELEREKQNRLNTENGHESF